MNSNGHVIISLSDEDGESGSDDSTFASEISDQVVENGIDRNLQEKGVIKSESTNVNSTQIKKKRRRKKKRKLKSTPPFSIRNNKDSPSPKQEASTSSATKKLNTVKGTDISKFDGNSSTKNSMKTPLDNRSHNAASLVKRIHSAPAVISKRMGRQDTVSSKVVRSENQDPKYVTDSSTLGRTSILMLSDKDKSKSDFVINNSAFQNSSAQHLDRQKTVLASLKNSIQRSLPPVALHTQNISLNNKAKQSSGLAFQPSSATSNGVVGNMGLSKVFLRYAQPAQPQKGIPPKRIGSSINPRTTPATNYHLDTSQFRAGLSPKSDHFYTASQNRQGFLEEPQMNSTLLSALQKQQEKCMNKQTSDKSFDDPLPKSILRKDSTPNSLTESEPVACIVQPRKSVRFNANDQIKYM